MDIALKKANADKKQETILMTQGSILKQILLFSIPLILGNLLQQMYNTVDSVIVGNFVGSNGLAAVGSSTMIIYLLIAFGQGAAIGAGVMTAQYLGAGNKAKVQTAVHTLAAIAIILGLVLTVGGVLFSRPLMVWMNTPAEILDDAVLYMQIYSAGMIFSAVYNIAAGILNAAGRSKLSLYYLAAASIVNIVLDLVLIVGLQMGVAGAAIATGISQAVSCILAVNFLMRVSADYRVNWRKIILERKMARRIIRIGLPTGVQNMMISAANILVQASVNGFGAAAVAGFGAYLKIDGFDILPVLSISMAITTFVGQNYGAGKLDRVRRGMWISVAAGIIYTLAAGILLLIFSEEVMSLFTNDPEVIAFGQQAMWYFCPFYWILSIMNILAGTVRGAGSSVPPMLVLIVSLCLFRFIWIQLAMPQLGSIDGLFILYPISWLIGAGLMIIYTWKGSWLPTHH